MAQEKLVNFQIKAHRVKVINSNGEMVGEFQTRDAIHMAQDEGLDLVQMSNDFVPICKIFDYNKFKFEQKKKEQRAAKNQSNQEVKEVQVSTTIEKNDLMTKAKQIEKFLAKKYYVKINLRMRGRENAHPEVSIGVVKNFLQLLTDNNIKYKINKNIIINNKNIDVIIQPE